MGSVVVNAASQSRQEQDTKGLAKSVKGGNAGSVMAKSPQGPPCPGIESPVLSPIEVLAQTGISDHHCLMIILSLPLG